MPSLVERMTKGIYRDIVDFLKTVLQSRLLYAGLAGIITSRVIYLVYKDFYFYFIPEQGEAQTYMAAIFILLLTGFWYLALSIYAFTRQNEDPYVLAALAEIYALSLVIWIMATYQANVAEWKWWDMMLAGNTASITIAIFIMFAIALFIAFANLGIAQKDNVSLNRLARNLEALQSEATAASSATAPSLADRYVKCEGCGLRYDGERHAQCPKCGKDAKRGGSIEGRLLAGLSQGMVRRRVEYFMRLIREGKPLDRDSITAADAMRYSLRASYSKYFMGLLTLTGLFGTFIGLMFSLEGIQGVVDTLNNFTDITRLQTTMTQSVKGLQTAFGTSIAGLACGMPGGLYLLIITNLQAKFYARMEDLTTMSLMPFLAELKEKVDAERALAAESARGENGVAAKTEPLLAAEEPSPKAEPEPAPVPPRADERKTEVRARPPAPGTRDPSASGAPGSGPTAPGPAAPVAAQGQGARPAVRPAQAGPGQTAQRGAPQRQGPPTTRENDPGQGT